MMTFSFKPSSRSTLPSIAASVSTFVVSWKEAAERNDSVASEALVIPRISGSNVASSPFSAFTRAFSYRNGVVKDLGNLGTNESTASAANAINAQGQIVGNSNGHAFIYENGAMRDLGTLGGASLILTTVLTVGNVEQALNAIWGVTKQRPWVRRIPDYLAVVLVSPMLLGVALSLGASLQSQWLVKRLLESPFFATLHDLGLSQAPTVLVMSGLTFLYWFLPNTEVRFRAALLGGAALAAERARGHARQVVGLEVDWEGIEEVFDRAGLPPQMPAAASRVAVPVYKYGTQIGRATTTAWSPTLKKLIALATVSREYTGEGSRVEVEMTVEAVRHRVPATVVPMPFFNPPRKTATPIA